MLELLEVNDVFLWASHCLESEELEVLNEPMNLVNYDLMHHIATPVKAVLKHQFSHSNCYLGMCC